MEEGKGGQVPSPSTTRGNEHQKKGKCRRRVTRPASMKGEKPQKTRMCCNWDRRLKCSDSQAISDYISSTLIALQSCCSHPLSTGKFPGLLRTALDWKSSLYRRHVTAPVDAGAAGTCVHVREGRRGNWMGTINSLGGGEEEFALGKKCISGLFRLWTAEPRGLNIQHRGRWTLATTTIKCRTSFKSWEEGESDRIWYHKCLFCRKIPASGYLKLEKEIQSSTPAVRQTTPPPPPSSPPLLPPHLVIRPISPFHNGLQHHLCTDHNNFDDPVALVRRGPVLVFDGGEHRISRRGGGPGVPRVPVYGRPVCGQRPVFALLCRVRGLLRPRVGHGWRREEAGGSGFDKSLMSLQIASSVTSGAWAGWALRCGCGERRVLRCGGGRLSLSLKRPGEVLPGRDERSWEGVTVVAGDLDGTGWTLGWKSERQNLRQSRCWMESWELGALEVGGVMEDARGNESLDEDVCRYVYIGRHWKVVGWWRWMEIDQARRGLEHCND